MLRVPGNSHHSVPIREVDQLNAHSVTSCLSDPSHTGTDHTSTGGDGEYLVTFIDDHGTHKVAPVLDDSCGDHPKPSAPANRVPVHGGALGEPIRGRGEDIRAS